MREIKFRGQQLEDINETSKTYASKKGTWRYGSYLYAHKYRDGEHAHLICNIYGENCVMCDKKTIGQYTGLKDKNGVEIYEGDIVKVQKISLDDVVYKATIVFQQIGRSGFAFAIDYKNDNGILYYGLQEQTYIEVIGNIHEVENE